MKSTRARNPRAKLSTHVASPPRERRADRWITHGIYQIATGKWPPGQRLPSVREAERAWGVDRRTVLEAYQRLAELGLVVCAPRSGYSVTKSAEFGRLSRHRHELDRLFERLLAEIEAQSELSPLGAFRYFAELAALRAADHPDCAFVECTAIQAEGHAREIREHLDVPCLPLTIAEIAGRRARIPAHVRTLLVSGFHFGELRALSRPGELHVASVPIEVSPALLEHIPKGVREAIVFESDDEEAHVIRDDVQAIGLELPLKVQVAHELEKALEAWRKKDARGRSVALVSPRLWGTLTPSWRDQARVLPIEFRIREEAWPKIADAIGLPLGALL
jgi:DNA-binding transcriptional regulator YhcF (GntR family)